jgi:two-component system alkaline phosphatase synthesis response regulator PhoP
VARVLIADDDELLREILQFKLENLGYEVVMAADGASALQAAQTLSPDVLILDSMMPSFSGPEVLKALKSQPSTEAIPVIMLTARRGQEDVVAALRAGAEDYLTKPFMPEELAIRIATILARRLIDD